MANIINSIKGVKWGTVFCVSCLIDSYQAEEFREDNISTMTILETGKYYCATLLSYNSSSSKGFFFSHKIFADSTRPKDKKSVKCKKESLQMADGDSRVIMTT